MTNFATLQTRVKRRVIDLPAAVTAEVPDLINEAVRELQDRHNFQTMQTLLTATTADLTRVLVAVPSDFKSFRGRPFRRAFLGKSVEMTVSPTRNAAEIAYGTATTDSGSPKLILRSELTNTGTSDLEVWPLPNTLSDWSDGLWRVVVPYWRYLPALAVDADTNWFTVNAIPFILNKATAEGFALNWDAERNALWEARAEVKLKAAVTLDKKQVLSSVTTLVVRRGAAETKARII